MNVMPAIFQDRSIGGNLNIVRFEMNVPTEVELQSLQGTRVSGRYGDRIMFPLSDGRVMYVPPIVAAQIEEQGITTGEPFQLCKTSVRDGRRRSIEWRVKRIDPAQRSMRSELYMPNRLSLTCSRRHCAYWRNCEREWGGEVPET
jgi:hypothetical protein